MNIAELHLHRYQLDPLHALNSRSSDASRAGALLRVTYRSDEVGYADCHPWPELGDLALEEQLSLLAQGQLTALTRRSLGFAAADAQARARGESLFSGLSIPPSHCLIPALAQLDEASLPGIAEQGFAFIKAKVGRDLDREMSTILQLAPLLQQLRLKLRLDFNTALDQRSLERFLALTERAHAVLDFIEDPFPFDAQAWSEVRRRHAVKLALDRGSDCNEISAEAVDFLVLKPATQDPQTLMELALRHHLMLCVTSAMDHPVGQMGAALVAARIAHDHPHILAHCGLLSHRVYDSNEFIDHLRSNGPSLLPATGAGLGFGELLSAVAWHPLI